MNRIALVALLLVGVAAGGYFWLGRGGDARPAQTSEGLRHAPAGQDLSVPAPSGRQLAVATFSTGCFWCTESDFDKVPGVVTTTSGYTGGHLFQPTYNQVSAGGTGHVESVELQYDPAVVTYEQLLDVYWHNVDPFNGHGQFCDYGEQYRPVIWVHDEAQQAAAAASKEQVERLFNKRTVVSIDKAGTFYPAEDYHQDFHIKSNIRYRYYRWACGRDARLAEIWRPYAD